MRLKLTTHCQIRIQERCIPIDHIKKAIAEPDKKEDAFEGLIKVSKKIEGRILKVVYCKEGFKDKKDEYMVITVYYPK